MSKFRSARQQDYHATERPQGSVIGLIPQNPVASQTSLKGMSDAQKKNVKRKQKRHATAAEADHTPDNWDKDSSPEEVDEVMARKVAQDVELDNDAESALRDVGSAKDRCPSGTPVSNPGSTLFKSALKSSSSNPQVPPIQRLVPSKPEPIPRYQDDVKSRAAKTGAAEAGAKLFGSALSHLDRVPVDPDPEAIEKRNRALRKKLIQVGVDKAFILLTHHNLIPSCAFNGIKAEQLQTRMAEGHHLLPEQLEKIDKMDEIRRQLLNMNI